jgi:hypothetical protein
MADLARGKQIFDNRVEYPLTKQSGVRDYVFNFVPTNTGSAASKAYGRQSRAFFNAFFRQHIKRDVHTLEDLVNSLNQDLTGQGVQSIREIIIVAHGTRFQLLFPLLNDTSLKEFKYLDDYSLALLQKDMRAGKYKPFADNRKAVVAHLQTNSWVTVRACNFGNSRKALYALYSLFGGKANVYAPTEFMFFGTLLTGETMRLGTRARVHSHLLKQRLLPKSITAARREAIVDALLQVEGPAPDKFSAVFQLLSTSTDVPTPEGAALIQALDQPSINNWLKTTIQQELNVTFTSRATIQKLDRPTSHWLIKDTIVLKDRLTLKDGAEEDGEFGIQYLISREDGISVHDNKPTATFWAQAQIVDAATSFQFPIQLFLNQAEHDALAGILCTLAFYVDDPSAEPQDKLNYDHMLSLLNSATSVAAPLSPDLIAALNVNNDFLLHNDHIFISPSATIRQPSAGAGPFDSWVIKDEGRNYVARLIVRPTDTGTKAHTIVVCMDDDPKVRAHRIDGLFSTLFGADPDAPGTELAAYFDQLSINDLVNLIDFLRSPFKPGNSFYINQAQEALVRKKDFGDWAAQNDPLRADRPLDGTYRQLSISEMQDLQANVYEFNFNQFWNEVKASSHFSTSFQTDLFLEDPSLEKQLKIDDLDARTVPQDSEDDSPSLDANDLSRADTRGHEKLVASNKSLFHVPESLDAGCENFAAAVTAWNASQNLAPQALKDLLDNHQTKDGTSYWDIIVDLVSKYGWLSKLAKMTELIELPSIPKDTRGLVLEGAKKSVKWAIQQEIRQAEIAALEAGATDAAFFVTRTGVLEGTLGVLWAAGPILTVWDMYKKILDQQVATDNYWELQGKLTAVRQWLRAFIAFAQANEDNFPDEVQLNISTPWDIRTDLPYYLSRYFKEEYDEFGYVGTVSFAPERIQKGFDDGVTLMVQAGRELLTSAAEEARDLPRQSGLDSCQIAVLARAGMLDMQKLTAQVASEFADTLLHKLPQVRP